MIGHARNSKAPIRNNKSMTATSAQTLYGGEKMENTQTQPLLVSWVVKNGNQQQSTCNHKITETPSVVLLYKTKNHLNLVQTL
jgi:hypothetical protein